MKTRIALLLALATVGVATYAANTLATPSSGFTGTTLAKATLGKLNIRAHTTTPANPSERVSAEVWETLLKTKGTSDMYVQSNVWTPGGTTGWHTHPGPSLVVVTQGTLTVYDGDDASCTPHVYSTDGDNAFVDVGGGDVHLIRNDSSTEARTVAVQFVPSGATRRIDAAAPDGCNP